MIVAALTSRCCLMKGYDAPSLAPSSAEVAVVWSFVYLALRHNLELVLLCLGRRRPRRDRDPRVAPQAWCATP